jgi:uncharacterized membrane protein
MADQPSQENKFPDTEAVVVAEPIRSDIGETISGGLKDKSEMSDAALLMYRSGFSGPLPPPHILKGYDLVQSSFAERIVILAEEQSRHRMGIEKKVIKGDDGRAWAGLGAAFFISCMTMILSYDLIKSDKEIPGTILSTASLASLVGTFIYGTNKRSEEREKKRRDLLDSVEEGNS